ncbi:MAG: M48 family metallopeptidase [Clostridia bacterium]|nr:M48 family metallopeptidase [Clostridia bacterium]
MTFKIIAIAILTVMYIADVMLNVSKIKSGKNAIPANVADIYDAEEYKKWQRYNAEHIKVQIISGTVGFIVGVALLAFDVYAAFASLFTDNAYVQMLAVVLLFVATDLLLVPFSYWSTMIIEQKYGFNRTTKKTFCIDVIKDNVINFVLTAALGAVVTLLHIGLGDWILLVFSAVLIVFVLIVTLISPMLLRVYNKFTPLEDGELKDKLTSLLEKNGYTVKAIEVMDASRRTGKLNAFFVGTGKLKSIVLYDNLIEKLTPDEICSVFAHELGHGLHKDTQKLQLINSLNLILLAVLVWLNLKFPSICVSFGFDGINYGFILYLCLAVEFAFINPLTRIVANVFSRRFEYSADLHAVREGYGAELISSLKKLTKENFGNIAPSNLSIMLEYDHPTLSQRIEFIEKNTVADSGN